MSPLDRIARSLHEMDVRRERYYATTPGTFTADTAQFAPPISPEKPKKIFRWATGVDVGLPPEPRKIPITHKGSSEPVKIPVKGKPSPVQEEQTPPLPEIGKPATDMPVSLKPPLKPKASKPLVFMPGNEKERAQASKAGMVDLPEKKAPVEEAKPAAKEVEPPVAPEKGKTGKKGPSSLLELELPIKFGKRRWTDARPGHPARETDLWERNKLIKTLKNEGYDDRTIHRILNDKYGQRFRDAVRGLPKSKETKVVRPEGMESKPSPLPEVANPVNEPQSPEQTEFDKIPWVEKPPKPIGKLKEDVISPTEGGRRIPITHKGNPNSVKIPVQGKPAVSPVNPPAKTPAEVPAKVQEEIPEEKPKSYPAGPIRRSKDRPSPVKPEVQEPVKLEPKEPSKPTSAFEEVKNRPGRPSNEEQEGKKYLNQAEEVIPPSEFGKDAKHEKVEKAPRWVSKLDLSKASLGEPVDPSVPSQIAASQKEMAARQAEIRKAKMASGEQALRGALARATRARAGQGSAKDLEFLKKVDAIKTRPESELASIARETGLDLESADPRDPIDQVKEAIQQHRVPDKAEQNLRKDWAKKRRKEKVRESIASAAAIGHLMGPLLQDRGFQEFLKARNSSEGQQS